MAWTKPNKNSRLNPFKSQSSMAAKHLHNQPPTQRVSLYRSLLHLQSTPRIKPIKQIHAQIVISGAHDSLPFLTKLLTLSISAGSIFYARKLLFSIKNPDAFLFGSLIKASTKHHFPLHSLIFYRRMLSCSVSHSNHAFTAVIKACAQLGSAKLGRAVHSHVIVSGFASDLFVPAALISFYAQCNELDVAREVFDKISERTVVAWTSMISGYEQNGFAEEALGLFCKLRDLDIGFNHATFVSALSACSHLGAFGLGCWIHEYIKINNFDVNVVLGTALIILYARCGNVKCAREVFDSMEERNVVSWTAMISGYGMHGYGEEAMDLFRLMKHFGSRPNDITFIAVLAACAHTGQLEEGRSAFASMKQDYKLVPHMEHHVCMVDMFGRAGLLNEAFQHIKDEIKSSKPAPEVWTAMLGACKMHRNLDIGVVAAEHLLATEPQHPGHYVLLSNIYAMAGRMDRVEMVRNIMIRKGLKKQVGYATIEVDQKTYLFIMGDKSHPETTAIYSYLDDLMERIRAAGYVVASESVMHELEEEERDYALRCHSEKLAIAFGLLKTEQGSAIRIVKNLRMCEDCHAAIKFISLVSNREIIVRDKLRFHHFRDGTCSCSDYW